MIETASDRRDFICTLSNGAQVRSDAGVSACIYRDPYVSTESAQGLEIADRAASFTVSDDEAKRLRIARGSLVFITQPDKERIKYRIRNAEPDGSGMTRFDCEDPGP